jgi:hypothetical protein
MTKSKRITIDELRQLLDYNPTTGDLIWKRRPNIPQGWNTKYAGTVAGCEGSGCRVVRIYQRGYAAHHLIWALTRGCWPILTIDHRNRDWRDNRLDNLREATPVQQCHNRSRTTSLPKGVRRQRDRFIAVIGSFATAQEAHVVWLSAAKAVYGDFFTVL